MTLEEGDESKATAMEKATQLFECVTKNMGYYLTETVFASMRNQNMRC